MSIRVAVTYVFAEDLIEARSVVRFGGIAEDGSEVVFATEHRAGAALATALHTETDDIEVDLESWQVLNHEGAF